MNLSNLENVLQRNLRTQPGSAFLEYWKVQILANLCWFMFLLVCPRKLDTSLSIEYFFRKLDLNITSTSTIKIDYSGFNLTFQK